VFKETDERGRGLEGVEEENVKKPISLEELP
jgi:hypothetical protein